MTSLKNEEPHYIRKTTEVEWLFKQSYMGGEEHIIIATSIGDTVCDEVSLANQFTHVHTLCGKILKFNDKYSVIRRRKGPVRRLCIHCLMQNGDIKQTKRFWKEEPDLPF